MLPLSFNILMELAKVILYRITHIENVKHILSHGITHKRSLHRNPNYKDIGDKSLIENRDTKTVLVENGEYSGQIGFKTITLGEYTPFYFGVRMPMLYVAQQGGNFVERPIPPENIIYLACPLLKVVHGNTDYFFSDGHATDMLSTFYDHTKIDDLSIIIDWDAIKSKYWGGSENLDVKRKKQAEFLVSWDISPDKIIGFGCFNENAKKTLISLGVNSEIIKVIPDAYY